MLFLIACVHQPDVPVVRTHAGDATAARDAIVTADLPRFHGLMNNMAGEFPLRGRSRKAQTATIAAITEAKAATSVAEAAAAYGELGLACGGCHAATSAVLPGTVTLPGSGDGVRAEMALHDRAVALVWSGLVRPSEEELKAGVDAFAQSFLRTPDGTDPTVDALDQGVTNRAQELIEAAPSERGGRFGALLAACAGCHLSPPPGLEPQPD